MMYQSWVNRTAETKARQYACKRNRLNLRKTFLEYVKMTGCVDCGYRERLEALEFDHANCHRIRTHQRRIAGSPALSEGYTPSLATPYPVVAPVMAEQGPPV